MRGHHVEQLDVAGFVLVAEDVVAVVVAQHAGDMEVVQADDVQHEADGLACVQVEQEVYIVGQLGDLEIVALASFDNNVKWN